MLMYTQDVCSYMYTHWAMINKVRVVVNARDLVIYRHSVDAYKLQNSLYFSLYPCERHPSGTLYCTVYTIFYIHPSVDFTLHGRCRVLFEHNCNIQSTSEKSKIWVTWKNRLIRQFDLSEVNVDISTYPKLTRFMYYLSIT